MKLQCLFLFAAALLLAACGQSHLETLEGDWKPDLAESVRLLGSPGDNPFHGALGLAVDIHAKTLSLTYKDRQEKLPFAVMSGSGDMLILQAGAGVRLFFEFRNKKTVVVRTDDAPHGLVLTRVE